MRELATGVALANGAATIAAPMPAVIATAAIHIRFFILSSPFWATRPYNMTRQLSRIDTPMKQGI